MLILEMIALTYDLPKLMLTVFKNNRAAMRFYTEKLNYVIDDNSPSKFGDSDELYEILSLNVTDMDKDKGTQISIKRDSLTTRARYQVLAKKSGLEKEVTGSVTVQPETTRSAVAVPVYVSPLLEIETCSSTGKQELRRKEIPFSSPPEAIVSSSCTTTAMTKSEKVEKETCLMPGPASQPATPRTR